MKNNENSNGGTINQPIPEICRYRTSSNSVQPTTDIKFLYNFTKQINQKSTRSTTRLKKKRLLAHLTVLIVNSIPRSRSDLTHFQSNLTKKLFQRMLYPEIHPDLEVCRIVFGRSRSRHRSIDFAGKRSNRDLSCCFVFVLLDTESTGKPDRSDPGISLESEREMAGCGPRVASLQDRGEGQRLEEEATRKGR